MGKVDSVMTETLHSSYPLATRIRITAQQLRDRQKSDIPMQMNIERFADLFEAVALLLEERG
jgi:hypothetical protein